MHPGALSLKEIQFRLGVPQHVLIHLCERGVIEPDLLDGKGRGKFRLFSKRNLFEFAVALEMRKYDLPLRLIAAVVKMLVHFEVAANNHLKGFSLPDSLAQSGVAFQLFLFDQDLLVFSVGHKLLLSIDGILRDDRQVIRLRKLTALPKDFRTCITINLEKIAADLHPQGQSDGEAGRRVTNRKD